MITFSNEDKRWLEIVFYLLCRKILSINQKQSDIISFIQGFRWTNMFDCDILINIIKNRKILLDPGFPPTKQEFLVAMNDPNCKLRITRADAIRELIKDTEYRYTRHDIFHAKLKEEIHQTLLYPKLDNANIHATIYSFLIAIRYLSDIIKYIKF